MEILSASLVFAIVISYNGVRNSFRQVSALKRVAKLFLGPFLEPQYPKSNTGSKQEPHLRYRPDQWLTELREQILTIRTAL